MKKFLSKRSGAVIVTIIVILLSVYFGAQRSLGIAVRKVSNGFSDGVYFTDDSGEAYTHKSIRSQLINRLDACTNMVSIVNNFSELSEKTEALRNATNDMKDLIYGNGTPKQLCQANKDLDSAYSELYASVPFDELDNSDNDNIDEVNSIMTGTKSVIDSSGYNESVREFDNKTLSVFPTNILQKVCFVDSPEIFE